MVGGTVGTYQLLERIGAGGMGEVWLAKHTLLGRRAAIKLLRPALSSQPDIVNRFFNEARAATTIADPGIVQIFDFGIHENGTAYIVMELLEGETLEARKRRRGRIPVEEAVRILRQVASSLGAAHARGIVHRDVKPDNIFLTRDPEVPGGERAKVLDFGIAKLLGDTQVVTQTAAIMGTPEYMSPEQCRGAGKVDERSDVYALGCVLFAAIAGRPPFQAEGGGEIIAMHLREPAPALSSIVRVDRGLDELVARCLAKEPSRRFASGSELAAALEHLLARVRPPTNPPPLGLAATVAPTIAPTVPRTVAPNSAPNVAANVAPTVWPSAPPTVWPSVPPTEPPPAATVLPSSATPIAPPAPASPTTLSGSAVSAATPARRSYNSLAIGGGAALVVAGLGVYLLARGGSSDTPSAPAPAPPTTAVTPSHAAPPPPPSKPTPAPAPKQDLGEQTKLRILRAFAAFAQWSPAHAGAACPAAKDLIDPHGDGHELDDPWGHPIAITCTDQPADQIIGAIVLGPDGTLGTDDDTASWTLGRDVTSFVRGARWKTSRRSSSSSSSSSSASSSAAKHSPPPPPPPPATKDIPTTRTPDPPTPAKPGEGDIPRVRK